MYSWPSEAALGADQRLDPHFGVVAVLNHAKGIGKKFLAPTVVRP